MLIKRSRKTSALNSVALIEEKEQWNASCYDIEEGNTLELFENLEFPPSLNSIFFIETSCRGRLTSRQACSIEAAARAHPRSIIYVLFSAPVSKTMVKSKIFARLLLFYNIKFVRILFRDYAKNTPLDTMIATTPFYKSKWWIEHSSDIFRYLTLYKYGGIYLDTDMLVVKSLEPLGYNWVGRQDNLSVNGAAIALSLDKLGQRVAKALVMELKTSYRYDLFGRNGPEAVTKVLQEICSTPNVTEWSSETCSARDAYLLL
ncbi:unnamed protein product [Arctia plantaginis]|uniref:Alpha 1,4-glycosyltransferase domain-containing protein n=1 Tax=Arctia plantaginis TaxID=874455 RepID=A0A8S1AZ03_ARCPL|nr:unnamed protein product [Arctia plantaginis]